MVDISVNKAKPELEDKYMQGFYERKMEYYKVRSFVLI